MSCPIYNESPDLLMDYASGKLEFESQQRMDAHVQKCEICGDALAAQAMVWKAMDEWEAEPVSMDFDAKLYARIESEQTSVWARVKSFVVGDGFRWQPTAVAMAGTAALFLGVFLFQPPSVSEPKDGVAIEAHEIEQAERALEDVDMVDKLFAESKSEAQAL